MEFLNLTQNQTHYPVDKAEVSKPIEIYIWYIVQNVEMLYTANWIEKWNFHEKKTES